MYRVCSSPPIAGRYPVILRDTTGGGVSYFCSTIVFNPLALRALPLYSLTETQGERRVNSITSTSGIFNPTPRRYAPQLSPYILRYKTQGRRVIPASEMKSGIGLFSLPFCSSPQCYGAGERLKRFFCGLSKGGV